MPNTFERQSQLLSRRSFLGFVITSVPIANGINIGMLFPVQRQALDDAMLNAMAGAILPSEAGADGIRNSVTQFQTWVKEYLPGAERNHGYGSARIQNTGTDPAPRWAEQLRSLDVDARTKHNNGFAALGLSERREIVRAQLESNRANTIPGDVAGAAHVALALLASYYGSADATDLCYGVAIARNTCRPLANSLQMPVPLTRRGAP